MSEELRQQLLEAHRQVFEGLLDAVRDLDEAAWDTPTGCPGWSVKDQLSHVVGVERAMLGDPPDEVELPALAHVRDDFARAVEVAVEARRPRSPAEIVAEARETFRRRLAALADLDPTRLGEPLDGPAGMQMKGSQMLRTRVFDMVCHEHDIRRALGRPGRGVGPHVDISLETVVRAWARALPAAADTSGVLEVLVDGRGPVRIDVADGSIHRDGDGPQPTATLHIDLPTLLALAGGRDDAPEPARLRLTGDTNWARTVLEHAAITP